MDIRKIFGFNVRRLRLAAGLSQEAAADLFGISRSHESAIERGRQNCTLQTQAQIAKILNCAPMELLNEDKARHFAADLATANGTPYPRVRR
jgi:transcriptional regulator with XRE-family HTH domain